MTIRRTLLGTTLASIMMLGCGSAEPPMPVNPPDPAPVAKVPVKTKKAKVPVLGPEGLVP